MKTRTPNTEQSTAIYISSSFSIQHSMLDVLFLTKSLKAHAAQKYLSTYGICAYALVLPLSVP